MVKEVVLHNGVPISCGRRRRPSASSACYTATIVILKSLLLRVGLARVPGASPMPDGQDDQSGRVHPVDNAIGPVQDLANIDPADLGYSPAAPRVVSEGGHIGKQLINPLGGRGGPVHGDVGCDL